MNLPGGLIIDSKWVSSYKFAPANGKLELALAESGLDATSLPEQVTQALSAALDSVGTQQVDSSLVRQLTTGDRQFLLFRLWALLNPGFHWMTQSCQSCSEPFQFRLNVHELPVKPAGEDFPQCEVSLLQGDFYLRLPTGSDQEAIALAADVETSRQWLLERILSPVNNKANIQVSELTEKDRQLIDETMERMSPEMARVIQAECPECGNSNEYPLSPLSFLQDVTAKLFSEIHTIAINYHWPEAEILDMPRQRRKHYLQMINQHRGSYDAASHLDMDTQEGMV